MSASVTFWEDVYKRQDFTAHVLSLSDSRDELSELLTLIAAAARDLLAFKSDASAPPLFFTDRNAAAELAGKITAEKLIAVCLLYTSRCV